MKNLERRYDLKYLITPNYKSQEQLRPQTVVNGPKEELKTAQNFNDPSLKNQKLQSEASRSLTKLVVNLSPQ